MVTNVFVTAHLMYLVARSSYTGAACDTSLAILHLTTIIMLNPDEDTQQQLGEDSQQPFGPGDMDTQAEVEGEDC
jgi:hypothetical protein